MVQSQNKMDKAMTNEQFTQVVDAILQGKYSWACVLILRFAGYNPLHYIPYRTYNRLMKENHSMQQQQSDYQQQRNKSIVNSTNSIQDLDYLESLREHQSKVHGGQHSYFINCTDMDSLRIDVDILLN